MKELEFGYETRLEGVDFDTARERVTKALGEQGFGVLTSIDVKKTLKEKIGVDMRRYEILGACNPKLAHQAIEAYSDIGLLLPCNVVVEQVDGATRVSLIKPRALFEMIRDPRVEPIAEKVDELVRNVIATLEH
jgi:uncharacterized protein (DUF302 family)